LVSLSGYGVELAVKSTEYKALDDLALLKHEKENDGLFLKYFKFLIK